MTTFLEQVGDYLVRWSVWLAALVTLAGVVGFAAWAIVRPRIDLVRAILIAVLGGLVVASLADRFDARGPSVGVLRHPLPWAWALAGAALGTALLMGWALRGERPDVTDS